MVPFFLLMSRLTHKLKQGSKTALHDTVKLYNAVSHVMDAVLFAAEALVSHLPSDESLRLEKAAHCLAEAVAFDTYESVWMLRYAVSPVTGLLF